MSKKAPVDVRLCILCEDVREEKLNKHSLIGVYSGDILISEIPGTVAMSFFLEMTVRKVGAFDMRFRLSGPGEHSAVLTARVSVEEVKGVAVLKTPRIDVGIDQAGTFRFDWSVDGKDWQNLITKQISLMNPASTASQQPSEQSQPVAQESSSPPEPSRPSAQARRPRKKAPVRLRSHP